METTEMDEIGALDHFKGCHMEKNNDLTGEKHVQKSKNKG
jgi:hypothetical protein